MIHIDTEKKVIRGICKAKDFSKEMRELEQYVRLRQRFIGDVEE